MKTLLIHLNDGQSWYVQAIHFYHEQRIARVVHMPGEKDLPTELRIMDISSIEPA